MRRRSGSQLVAPAAITLLGTAVLLAVGRSAGHAQSPTPAASASITAQPLSPGGSAGRGLYQQDCAWCHGTQGEGTLRGPNLMGVGAASADFVLRTGRMPIVNVERQPQRKTPAYTPRQIAELDAFVASLGPGPPIPVADPQAGSLGEGSQLYQVNCAACHSSTGIGGALTNGLQAPGLQDSTPTEIAEAVRLGGQGLRTGNMPKFGPDALDQRQLDSVIRYVLYLQHPRDRGGAGLTHLGPIIEGLVAWAGGLLILVVFIRWIGTKSR
jgi:quinol---cytochrome-c reductase cytochrome c subunit